MIMNPSLLFPRSYVANANVILPYPTICTDVDPKAMYFIRRWKGLFFERCKFWFGQLRPSSSTDLNSLILIRGSKQLWYSITILYKCGRRSSGRVNFEPQCSLTTVVDSSCPGQREVLVVGRHHCQSSSQSPMQGRRGQTRMLGQGWKVELSSLSKH